MYKIEKQKNLLITKNEKQYEKTNYKKQISLVKEKKH